MWDLETLNKLNEQWVNRLKRQREPCAPSAPEQIITEETEKDVHGKGKGKA